MESIAMASSPRVPVTLGIVLLVLALPLVASPATAEQQIQPYNVPSSAVIRGVFGIGVLLCATPGVPDAIVDTVRNGPCFDFAGSEGRFFAVSAQDFFWTDTSVTIAIDVNGDGCVSESCNGIPNSADDYRLSNCGPVAGMLPIPDTGVPRTIQTFLRGLDVTADLRICGATQGEAAFDVF